MLVNPEFAQYVGEETHADNVTTSVLAAGLTSVLTMRTPQVARRVLGAQMTVTQTVTWDDPRDTDPVTGRMTLTVLGVPAQCDGPLSLASTPTGSTLSYDADFVVKIPLVGRKIEEMAAKHITSIMSACESVGNAWLASHPA